jgi:hypothetical protein
MTGPGGPNPQGASRSPYSPRLMGAPLNIVTGHAPGHIADRFCELLEYAEAWPPEEFRRLVRSLRGELAYAGEGALRRRRPAGPIRACPANLSGRVW